MHTNNFPDTNTLFKDFKNREQLLRAVKRYSIRKVMYYRPDIYTHSLHVGWIIHSLASNLIDAYGDTIDIDKAIIMAFVHDDLEVIMGDVQAAHKVKMNEKQTRELHQTEKNAINRIAKKFPATLGPYNYRKLLLEAQTQNTFESEVMKLGDWLDALGESLHEIFAGNTSFTKSTTDEFGTHPNPVEFYITRHKEFPIKFPKLKPLFATKSPFLIPIKALDIQQTALHSKPHTKESIQQNTGCAQYDEWKHVIKQYAGPEEYEKLYSQMEFI